MTDEAQTSTETVAEQPPVAQDTAPVVEATEVAPKPEAAPEAAQAAPEAVPAQSPASEPAVDTVRDAVSVILAAVDDDAALTAYAKEQLAEFLPAPIHNPNALRGVPAGPAPHPRSHHRH